MPALEEPKTAVAETRVLPPPIEEARRPSGDATRSADADCQESGSCLAVKQPAKQPPQHPRKHSDLFADR